MVIHSETSSSSSNINWFARFSPSTFLHCDGVALNLQNLCDKIPISDKTSVIFLCSGPEASEVMEFAFWRQFLAIKGQNLCYQD